MQNGKIFRFILLLFFVAEWNTHTHTHTHTHTLYMQFKEKYFVGIDDECRGCYMLQWVKKEIELQCCGRIRVIRGNVEKESITVG
jgi:hypothetical protein